MFTAMPLSHAAAQAADADGTSQSLTRMRYNNPGLVVDLGVGLWANPLPMDLDGDGVLDMIVASMGVPERGIYRFEPADDAQPMATYKPGEKFAAAVHNLRSCQTSDGRWVVLSPGKIYKDFARSGLSVSEPIPYETEFYTGRANHWSLFDYDGDGLDDLIIGADDWREYGWDDAYDDHGNWTNGPLRGFVWWVKNTGTNQDPVYGKARQIMAGDKPVETYGNPCPSFADFTGNGLPDLICGEFVDRISFYENVGTREAPRYNEGRFIEVDGKVFKMELEMIVPVAVDWDRDGHTDLVVGQEDGRIVLLRNTGGMRGGMPVFEAPVFFRQLADEVKIGALCTPSSVDWDGDGDTDLIVGDTAGFVSFLENLGGNPVKWAAPVRLEAGGEVLRIMAGENGSIQGPAEAKWGYTVAETADWDGDGLPDLLLNNILGRVYWYKNIGTRQSPRLAAAQPVLLQRHDPVHNPDWNWWVPAHDDFVTQWRISLQAIDLTGDGVLDLVTLDKDGFLSLFERRQFDGQWKLDAPRHIFSVNPGTPSTFNFKHEERSFDENGDGVNDLTVLDEQGRMPFYHRVHGTNDRKPNMRGIPAVRADADDADMVSALRLSSAWAGRSGRRKFVVADWDLDGRLDLLVNSVTVNFLKNVADEPGRFVFKDMGPIDSQTVLAGHTTCPEVIDLNVDGAPDIVVGAEDGFIYQMFNPHAPK
ncbi:MAG: VCBS repeat-containing protein [Phycisphaerales bacterium]